MMLVVIPGKTHTGNPIFFVYRFNFGMRVFLLDGFVQTTDRSIASSRRAREKYDYRDRDDEDNVISVSSSAFNTQANDDR